MLTNCDDDLFEETQRAFRERFDLVVTAERVRDYKPSLAHFRYFARSTGAARDDWVHVACSWYHDIAPARELALAPVWLDRDRTGEDPSSASAYLQSAADVPDAVARLSCHDRSSNRLRRFSQRELAGFERELHLFPDDETLWRTLPGVPNSAGNLALHVAGNLQHFVGAVLGGSAYRSRSRRRVFAPVGIAGRTRRGASEGRRRRPDRRART